VLQGCGKLQGSMSCEVPFSTSLQPDKNLYVCVCMIHEKPGQTKKVVLVLILTTTFAAKKSVLDSIYSDCSGSWRFIVYSTHGRPLDTACTYSYRG